MCRKNQCRLFAVVISKKRSEREWLRFEKFGVGSVGGVGREGAEVVRTLVFHGVELVLPMSAFMGVLPDRGGIYLNDFSWF